MLQKHKLIHTGAALLLLLSFSVSTAIPFMTGRAYADSSVAPKGNFTYVFLSATTQGCSLSNLAITSSDASFNNPFPLGVGPISYQTHSGSTYKFSNMGQNVQINVNKASPATGTYISGSIKKTIPLSGVGAFNVCFGKGADNLSGKITALLKVNFGETDSTKTIQDAQVTISCVGASSSPNCLPTLIGAGQSVKPSIASLTDKTVSFKYPFTGLILGQKYKVCYSADYIIGSSGKDGDPVCKEVTATKAGATVAMTAQGDASKLESPPKTESDTCEASGFSLSWIVCPMINGLANAVDGIYGHIVAPYLKINTFTASDKNTGVYKAWSDLRILGNIFLVIALIVIVFGESLGGGLIDAYTAKKALPKILIAAILINLSYYICAFLVDIFNVIGSGLFSLLVEPFKSSSGFGIHFNNYTEGETATLGLAGLVATGWGVAAGGAAVGGLATAALGFLWAFVLLPTLLILVAIVVTVFLRRALIIILTIISPVAFALYCLPNTEKYFKKWWDTFVETLVVFPIIAALFAAGNIAALVIPTTTGGALEGFAAIIAVMALIIPLALIPFAFKLAGGIIGKVHETMNDYGKRGHQALLGNPNDPRSWRNRSRRRLGQGWVRARSEAVHSFSEYQKGKGGNGWRRRTLGRGAGIMGRVANSGDLEAKVSEHNKEEAELRELKTSYGPDNSVRAFFATKRDDGKYYSTTTGQQFSAIEVAKAKQLYGHSESAAQTAIDYELGKAEPDQYNQMVLNAAAALESQGYSEHEINGIMKGVGFKNQAKYLDLKHSSFSKDKNGKWQRKVSYAPLAQNAAVDFGSYPISNMKPEPIKQLAEAHNRAEQALALPASATDADFAALGFEPTKATSDTPQKSAREVAQQALDDVESTAATLDMSRRRPGGVAAGEDGEAMPLASTGAPGRVDVEIQKLVNQVNESRARRNPQPPAAPDGQGPAGGSGPSGGSGGPTIIIPPSGYTGSQG